jgi:dienelactone hydrolase
MNATITGLALVLAAGANAALAQTPDYVPPSTPMGSGRWPAIMEMNAGLPTHTVYRPAQLPAAKLPIVAFANGGCQNLGNRFRPFLTEIASHGYLAIAIGPIGPREVEVKAGPGASQSSGDPAPGSPAAAHPELLNGVPAKDGGTRPSLTYAAQLTQAIDWAEAENRRAGSPYYGKLDPSRIAVMGQSCGGLQALDAAHDPRVGTLAVLNSGIFPENGRSWAMAAAHADKADLKTLHGSVLYLTGDPGDVAFPQAEDDFAQINHIPVFRAWREKTPHAGTYREKNGGAFGEVVVAWLDWQLKGSQAASRLFMGAECGLCRRPEWHVQHKGFTAAVVP